MEFEETTRRQSSPTAAGATETIESKQEEPLFQIEKTKRGKVIKVSAQKNGIDFVLEKMTLDTMCKWGDFIRDQRKTFNEYKDKTINSPFSEDNLLSGILETDAIIPFQHVAVINWKPAQDVWIVHATPVGQSVKEVCMTLSAEEGFPVIANMGIFRTMEYMLHPEKPKTKGLAEKVHLFAVAAADEVYSDLHYMYTAPIRDMKGIMLAKRNKLGLLWYVYEDGNPPPFVPPRFSYDPYRDVTLPINIDGVVREYNMPSFMGLPPLLVGEQMIFDVKKMKAEFLAN
ncbi:MAG: hypothetical protein K2W94_00130 [Alphaproteobacteria bacterium]|nr:hypothetical protein [Alphaproteobacteria bacterium]